MSVAVSAILAVLIAHKPWVDRDVSNEAREEQLRPVAEAIAEAAPRPEDAALLLALGWEESRFAISVVRSGCAGLPARACDRRLARGFAQLHESACPEAFKLPVGTEESIRIEARCAIAQLHHHAARCRDHAASPWYGAFSGYATGGDCHWRGAEWRVLTARRMLAELAKLEADS